MERPTRDPLVSLVRVVVALWLSLFLVTAVGTLIWTTVDPLLTGIAGFALARSSSPRGEPSRRDEAARTGRTGTRLSDQRPRPSECGVERSETPRRTATAGRRERSEAAVHPPRGAKS